MRLPSSLQNLVNAFARLPGIGPKTSERLVFSLLKRPKEFVSELAEALQEFNKSVHTCPICFHFTIEEGVPCEICNDGKRDAATLAVVADSLDLLALETTEFNGLYHVLGGTINPLQGTPPEDLRIKELLERINQSTGEEIGFKEIILAFDPTQDGELTALHIKRSLEGLPIKMTRLGRGLPQGGDLDYADEITLREALRGRREA